MTERGQAGERAEGRQGVEQSEGVILDAVDDCGEHKRHTSR